MPPTALSSSLGHEAMDYASPHMPLHTDGGATVISTGSGSNSNPLTPTHSTHGSTHHHPHATSSTSFKHGFKHQPNQYPTTIEHIRIQNSLPTTPTRHQPAPLSLSSEHNLMMMNDPLRAATNGSGFQPTTTNKGFVSLVDISSVNAADAAASRLASDANPNLLDSAKKPMSQPTKRLKMMGDNEARSGYMRLSDEWEGIANVDDGEDIYNDLIGEGRENGGVVAAAMTGDDIKMGEDGGISPFSSLPPSPSMDPLDVDGPNSDPNANPNADLNAHGAFISHSIHQPQQLRQALGEYHPTHPTHQQLQSSYSTRRPPRKKSTGGTSKKKRSKNKPFDSPDFITPTNVDIYVGSTKAENAEHALQMINRGEESWCKCRKSRCLKLYCDCFQAGNNCRQNCGCVECLNILEHSGKDGIRTNAVINALLRRPDAFEKRVRELGNGCGCKNSGCLKKYCECFREGNVCVADVCKCQGCKNIEGGEGQEGRNQGRREK
ncbi:hypothetical protein TL16_g01040 [Triparma laevis f. inornata]|uniref:CRC domain-containing protein n=1 Tax=Triparma laevis f. inornata TaxID=1714386 RepID=A0A9W6ZG74_9STRA|nr:hypothetical protein TL16_g01040 [Triparma laevis f. inornata]